MDALFNALQKISKWLSVIAGIALTLMMLLTVADVAMRAGGRPIIGTYEVAGLALALVIGFSIPKVSLRGQHIYMDFLVERLAPRSRMIVKTGTRILCIVLFLLVGYALFAIGNEFRISGEVSPTIKIPFFPMAYGVGICCFIECFVFLFEIVNGWRSIHE